MSSFNDLQFESLLVQAKDVEIVRSKYDELMRLSRSKMQILPKNYERSRSLAIFELSCETLKISFKNDEFKRRIGFSKDYKEARRLLSGILGFHETKDFNRHAFLLKFHLSESFEATVNHVLEKFDECYLQNMDNARRNTYNLKSKIYFVAGTFVAAYLQNHVSQSHMRDMISAIFTLTRLSILKFNCFIAKIESEGICRLCRCGSNPI